MSISVLHAPAWYPPYSMGGTETYVAGLVRALFRRDVQSAIAIPRPEGAPIEYSHNGVRVLTYPVGKAASRAETRGLVPPADFEMFRNLLAGFDVYHQHAMTRGCGAHHLAAARSAGLKTVLTAHVPGVICLRGSMLERGNEVCNGVVAPGRCGACWAQSRGVPSQFAQALGVLPLAISNLAARTPKLGRFGSLLSAKTHARNKLASIFEVARQADHIVAVCQWLYDALTSNGVPRSKLILSRQGLDAELIAALGSTQRGQRIGTRFGFIGRWDEIKGVHIAIEAFLRLPATLDATFVLHGAGTDADALTYRSRIETLAGRSKNIKIMPQVRQDELSRVFESIDALLVPSQWMETGPMVVLEAQAARVPVIGSNFGGIRELSTLGGDITLVQMSDVDAWTTAMLSFAQDRQRLAVGTSQVRTMDMVASEMVELYDSRS